MVRKKPISAIECVHWVHVTVYSPTYRGSIIKTLRWSGMPFFVRNKWAWYFRYRTALEQINHPRSRVEMTWGNEPAEGKSLFHIVKARVTSRKREVTRISNAIKKHETYMATFLIWEKDQDKDYQKALAKLDRVKSELQVAEKELQELHSKH